MSATPLIARRILTPADLEQQGFTPDQIRQLDWLRSIYPYTEHIGSNRELNRLRLLKWLHEHGRLDA